MAAGSTGERPFFEIITSIRYWVIHAVTLPAMLVPHLLLAGPAEAIVTLLAVRYLLTRPINLLGMAGIAVVATGGLAPIVLPESRTITHHEPDLTLIGLRLVYERNV